MSQILATFIPISLFIINHGTKLGRRAPEGQSSIPEFSKPSCLACPIFCLLAEGEQNHPKAVLRDRGWRCLSDF